MKFHDLKAVWPVSNIYKLVYTRNRSYDKVLEACLQYENYPLLTTGVCKGYSRISKEYKLSANVNKDKLIHKLFRN